MEFLGLVALAGMLSFGILLVPWEMIFGMPCQIKSRAASFSTTISSFTKLALGKHFKIKAIFFRRNLWKSSDPTHCRTNLHQLAENLCSWVLDKYFWSLWVTCYSVWLLSLCNFTLIFNWESLLATSVSYLLSYQPAPQRPCVFLSGSWRQQCCADSLLTATAFYFMFP